MSDSRSYTIFSDSFTKTQYNSFVSRLRNDPKPFTGFFREITLCLNFSFYETLASVMTYKKTTSCWQYIFLESARITEIKLQIQILVELKKVFRDSAKLTTASKYLVDSNHFTSFNIMDSKQFKCSINGN